jgi:hypothetical protein
MTKKHFLLILTGLALVFSAKGQTPFKHEFAIGGSFGMGVSSISFVPKVQVNQLTGYNAGLTARWLTEGFAGIVLELNYSQQGWDEHFDDPATYHYSRRLNYLDIPLLTHFYFGNKHFSLFFNLGPKIGFLISESSQKSAGLDSSSPPIDEITGKPHSSAQWDMPVENKFSWGICGGPGLEWRSPIGCFQLEGRYYYSLGDIYGNRKADYFPKSSAQVILGKLTYLIPLRK